MLAETKWSCDVVAASQHHSKELPLSCPFQHPVDAAGRLKEEGRYEKNQLAVGNTYAGDGSVASTVDKPGERAAAALAKQQAEKSQKQQLELARVAVENRRREAAAREEQEFAGSLNSLNVGSAVRAI